MNVLTSDRLAFLGALGSRASGTYVEWHERPTKRSAGHFKQVFFFNKVRENPSWGRNAIVAHIMEVHSVLH